MAAREAIALTPAAATEALSRARRLVALLVAVASVAYICRVDLTVIAPELMAELHLTQEQMGRAFSAFLIGYTVFQVPSGWLADRVGVRRLFTVMALGWALFTAALVLVGQRPLVAGVGALGWLLILRLAHGVMAAPTYPASGRAIAVFVPPRWLGRANGVVLASVGIGSAATPAILGPVAVRFGWRPAVALAAALAAAVAVIWHAFARKVPRASVRGTAILAVADTGETLVPQLAEPPPLWPSPMRQRSFWFLAASYLLQSYVGYVFVFWFYLYLVQVRHIALMKAAWLTTLPWLSTLVAVPLGGVASDWAVRAWGATWGRRSLPIAALILSAGLLSWGARAEGRWVVVASLTLSTALVLSTEGPFWASMNQLAGPRSGTAGGTMNFFGNLGGLISAAAMPWLAARVGWAQALSLTAGLALLSGVLWLNVKVELRETPGPPGAGTAL